jgi:aminomethyltransferase
VIKNETPVGVVSSGTLSPCLNTGIALAYVNHDAREVGSNVDILIRGKPVSSTIVKPPFVKKDWLSTQEQH